MPSPRRFKYTPARTVCVFLMCCAVFSARCQTPGMRSFETPSAVHSTALELILDKPYVSVMVNGKGPFRFLVDTGTGGQALITPALAEQLLLPVVGRAHLKDPSGIGEQRSEIASIDSLKIAGVEFSDVEAVVHNL